MEYGISLLATVSVREMPSRKSQMVNQLLFGDLFFIKAKKDSWYLIETVHDHYEGWVYQMQVHAVSESFFNKANKSTHYYLNMLSALIKSKDKVVPVTRGAQFYFWNDGKFKAGDTQFYFNKAVHKTPSSPSVHGVIEMAKNYLETPYLWGGRSPFGIDSSGLVQIVFKMNGLLLPRDAAQQVEKGEQILFVEAAKPGDLAFFENNEGIINHVGIILKGNTVLHSRGKVRIDTIDHQGIFNKDIGKYTHRLRVVKRVI